MQAVDEFFEGYPESRRLFDVLCGLVCSAGPASLRVTKSQIAFRRRAAFAWVWVPARYLRGITAPLVLTVVFGSRHPSARWQEIVEPRHGRFIHHAELYTVADLDDEVAGWLQRAWEGAG